MDGVTGLFYRNDLKVVQLGIGDPIVNENVVINGNFNIWQRGTSFAAVAGNTYTADRFSWQEGGAGVVTITKDTNTPDELSVASYKVDVTTASGALGVNDFYQVQYKVEGLDTIPMGIGTADAKQITISFWVSSPKIGIHCVTLRNNAVDRSYIAEYTVDVADTWEFKSVTLTGDLIGTWEKGNAGGISMSWALAAGTNFHTPAGVWTAGNFLASANQVNVMDTIGNEFFLSRVKVEIGDKATAFIARSFSEELDKAQRYYEKTFDLDVAPGATSADGEYRARAVSTNWHWWHEMSTRKRIIPSIAIWNLTTGLSGTIRNFSNASNVAATVTDIGQNMFVVNIGSIGNNLYGWLWTADAEL